MFGIPPPKSNPRLYWGARAIFHPSQHEEGVIDLLPDRQSHGELNDQQPDKEVFFNWINKVALPAVTSWARNQNPASREVFVASNNEFVLKATPNASFGYLYLGAWTRAEEQGNGDGYKKGIK